jgi:hypothetical protein
MTTVRFAITFLLTLSVPACGGGGAPTSPSSAGTFGTLVVFAPVGGTYTATLNNQTFTASGGFTVNLSPNSTYQITGSFVGGGLGIGFSTLGSGGVLSGSVRNISGPPSPDVSPCQVLYYNLDTPSVRRTFSVQIQTTSSVGSTCQ